MNNNQQIIIQAFNLQSVAQQVNVGLNASLRIGAGNLETSIYKSRIPAVNSDKPKYLSALGTPIWDTLIIKGGTYTDDIYGKSTYNDMRIDTCLMTLTQAHNVVLTPITGRSGEVIEYVGKGSFRINFKGGVFGSGNIRPQSDITNLRLMLGSTETITVKSSGFLTEWDITDFVITDKNIPQSMGGYNYQLFEFNAIQDLPVILASSPNA